MTDQHGRVIQKNSTTFSQHGRDYHSIGIHRGKLQQILLDQLPTNKIHLGKRLTRCDQTSHQLTFADGTQLKPDVLLACDGIHSQVRHSLFPDAKLRYSGQTCWRGVATTRLDTQRLNNPAEMWGNGVRFGYVPLSETETYWYATAVQPAGQKGLPKEQLYTLYQSFAPFVSEIIRETAVPQIIQHDLYELKTIPTWHRRNSLLIGDAAHAMTPNLGQGAAQSIEDAWAITHCLKQAQSPQDAFLRFEQIRRKKATQVSNTSWQIGQVTNWQNSFLCQLRNSLFRLTPSQLAAKQRKQLFSVPSPEQLFQANTV